MGKPMVKNLLRANAEIRVYDINSRVRSEYMGKAADSIEELAEFADIIFTMLPSGLEVTGIYRKIVSFGIQKSHLFVDCSTIEPALAEVLQKECEEAKNTMINAPVSGGTYLNWHNIYIKSPGVSGAENGTLTFMVGGSKDGYDKAYDLFRTMGKNIFYCGEGGRGLIAKICNNMLLGITMAGVCDSMALGQKLGIDLKILSEIINTSTGRCWITEHYSPVPGIMEDVPSSNNYSTGFSCSLLAKDLNIAVEEARRNHLELKLAPTISHVYEKLRNDGFLSKNDFSVLFQTYSKSA